VWRTSHCPAGKLSKKWHLGGIESLKNMKETCRGAKTWSIERPIFQNDNCEGYRVRESLEYSCRRANKVAIGWAIARKPQKHVLRSEELVYRALKLSRGQTFGGSKLGWKAQYGAQVDGALCSRRLYCHPRLPLVLIPSLPTCTGKWLSRKLPYISFVRTYEKWQFIAMRHTMRCAV